jgi:hypothetical protein
MEKDFLKRMETGHTLWADAQTPIGTDPRAALVQLTNAREEFLRAAMILPGNEQAAQQIAGVSAQIHTVEQAIQEQEKAEENLQKRLKEAVALLKELTKRQTLLSRRSQKLLRKRPPAPPEEKEAAATPARSEQTSIGEGTGTVLQTVTEVQSIIQKMLAAAYSTGKTLPPTEFDQAADKLKAADESQQSTITSLSPEALNWPAANSSLLTATRRMQEALALLADQSKGNNSDDESQEGDQFDQNDEGNMEWDESSQDSNLSMPIRSKNFKTSLDSRSLPTPNYTAEEIMKEEAANMEKRAQQKSSHAGANVEKNW